MASEARKLKHVFNPDFVAYYKTEAVGERNERMRKRKRRAGRSREPKNPQHDTC